MSENRATVFIVDDDEAIRSGLSMLLRAYGYRPEPFDSGEAFLERCADGLPERFMAILDLSMPEMDGLTLQAELARRGIVTQIVFLSGEGDIPVAVEAVQHGAIDFIEKPVETDMLIKRVEEALDAHESRRARRARDDIRTRIERLTPRERQVLDFIADGETSKGIAQELGISDRTVELHRSRVLKKLGVRNSTELLNHVIPNIELRKTTQN